MELVVDYPEGEPNVNQQSNHPGHDDGPGGWFHGQIGEVRKVFANETLLEGRGHELHRRHRIKLSLSGDEVPDLNDRSLIIRMRFLLIGWSWCTQSTRRSNHVPVGPGPTTSRTADGCQACIVSWRTTTS